MKIIEVKHLLVVTVGFRRTCRGSGCFVSQNPMKYSVITKFKRRFRVLKLIQRHKKSTIIPFIGETIGHTVD